MINALAARTKVDHPVEVPAVRPLTIAGRTP
jgi:hypothetical protein